jgi:WD40 repeat protein
VLAALGGQTMSVNLIVPNGKRSTLGIYGADGGVLLSNRAGVMQWSGLLPKTQDYFIDVKPETGTMSYTLQVTIPPSRIPTNLPTPSPSIAPIPIASNVIAPNNIKQMVRLDNMRITAFYPAQVSWSHDGKMIAIVDSLSDDVVLYDARNFKMLRQFSHRGDDSIVRTAFSPDGQIVATGSVGGTIKLWAASSGSEVSTLSGHIHQIQGIVFSPDGRILYTGASDSTVRLWETSTGRLLNTLRQSSTVYDIALSPDGRQLVSGSADAKVKLWDAVTGNEIKTFSGHTKAIYCVAFSINGRFIVSGAVDGVVKVWDISSQSELRNLTKHSGEIYGIVFSPDGRLLSIASDDGMIRFYDTSNWIEISGFYESSGISGNIAFSPDGQFFTYAAHEGVPFWGIKR